MIHHFYFAAAHLFLCSLTAVVAHAADRSYPTNAYFGDTHIHTNYSMDAFMAGGVRTTPDDAYRYAKGEAIAHPDGSQLRISGPPLDFLMVSDHASYLGVHTALLDPTSPTYGHPEAERLQPASAALVDVIANMRELTAEDHELMGPAVIADAWQKIIATRGRKSSQRPSDTTIPGSSPRSSAMSTPRRRAVGICTETSCSEEAPHRNRHSALATRVIQRTCGIGSTVCAPTASKRSPFPTT
jgi:hypothetical protein